jgi:hypothetical protein
MKLKNDLGQICNTPEENAKVMAASLKETFAKQGVFDPSVMEKVKQRDPTPYKWMDSSPSDEEISVAIKKLGDGKSGGEQKCHGEYYKALEKDDETRKYIRAVVSDFWKTGSFTEEISEREEIIERERDEVIPPDSRDYYVEVLQAYYRKDPISFGPNPRRPDTAIYRLYASYENCVTLDDVYEVPGASWFILGKNLKDGHLRIHRPEIPLPPMPVFEYAADDEGKTYDEWLQSKLVLLPKKGDLSLCKNWRSISLLDISSKIVSSVMSARMQIVQADHGLEMQTGFTKNRGTIDSLFSSRMALQKRKEHGKGTWVVFIDLMKAFASANREAIFESLKKFGLPPHFINIVRRLHSGTTLKITVEGIEEIIDCLIGVREGSIEGPGLFLFLFQAAVETMEWPVAKPQFSTKEDGKVRGERWNSKTKVQAFELWKCLFADDCVLFFESREDLVQGSNYLFNHLRRFGLHMHIGQGNVASKTEAMYCPAKGNAYEDGDTSNFNVGDESRRGFIHFTTSFKYLGSILTSSITSEGDVDARINAATAAFGALSKCIFKNRSVVKRMKGRIYSSFVVSILLYGSECWSMTEKLLDRLRSFHHCCVRSMCRITMRHTIKRRITTTSLLSQLEIKPIDHYYHSRLLRWAGHVSRMDMSRMPRKLLTGWVAHPRSIGRPLMNWGHTLEKALKSKRLPLKYKEWSKISDDRLAWRRHHTT